MQEITPSGPARWLARSRAWIHALALSVLTVLAGCGGGAVRSDSLAELRQGVAAAREQARVVFGDSNELARERSLQRVLTSTRPVLREEDFAVIVEPIAIAHWDVAFGVFDDYVSALQQLASPERSEAFGNAAVDLGNQLATGRTEVALHAGVVAAFTQLGRVLIEAKAQRDALSIIQMADPAVREALTLMADAVRDPVRIAVNANWRTALAQAGVEDWAPAVTANDQRAKVAAAERFLELIEKRDAQLAAVDGLRQSLLLLADAHTEAAKGTPADAATLIALADRHLSEAKALRERFGEIERKHEERRRQRAQQEREERSTTRPAGTGGSTNPEP
jgi:hypothetical protein